MFTEDSLWRQTGGGGGGGGGEGVMVLVAILCLVRSVDRLLFFFFPFSLLSNHHSYRQSFFLCNHHFLLLVNTRITIPHFRFQVNTTTTTTRIHFLTILPTILFPLLSPPSSPPPPPQTSPPPLPGLLNSAWPCSRLRHLNHLPIPMAAPRPHNATRCPSLHHFHLASLCLLHSPACPVHYQSSLAVSSSPFTTIITITSSFSAAGSHHRPRQTGEGKKQSIVSSHCCSSRFSQALWCKTRPDRKKK